METESFHLQPKLWGTLFHDRWSYGGMIVFGIAMWETYDGRVIPGFLPWVTPLVGVIALLVVIWRQLHIRYVFANGVLVPGRVFIRKSRKPNIVVDFSYEYQGKVYIKTGRIRSGIFREHQSWEVKLPIVVHPQHPRWAFIAEAFVNPLGQRESE